jgi:hypothetical protein
MNYYELKEKSTPRPWEADTEDCVLTKNGVRFAMIGTPVTGDYCGDSNTAMIAHCVNNFDKALDALKWVRGCSCPDERELDAIIKELETVGE